MVHSLFMVLNSKKGTYVNIVGGSIPQNLPGVWPVKGTVILIRKSKMKFLLLPQKGLWGDLAPAQSVLNWKKHTHRPFSELITRC